jgi:drug/metabolite transporter (DMT)-like permease
VAPELINKAIANIASITVARDVKNSFVYLPRQSRDYVNIYLVIFLTLVAALFTSFSQLQFKKGLKKRLDSVKDILWTLREKSIIIGLCGYAISFTLYLFALQTSQLSIVFPIFASSFIFVTIISAVTLREKITLIRVAGVIMIFVGITIVALTA